MSAPLPYAVTNGNVGQIGRRPVVLAELLVNETPEHVEIPWPHGFAALSKDSAHPRLFTEGVLVDGSRVLIGCSHPDLISGLNWVADEIDRATAARRRREAPR